MIKRLVWVILGQVFPNKTVKEDRYNTDKKGPAMGTRCFCTKMHWIEEKYTYILTWAARELRRKVSLGWAN